jgi:transmembrane sensor
MSDHAHQDATESAAEKIRVEAADWILKQRMGNAWSEDERLALTAWQAQSTAHLLAYLRLEAAWKQTDRLAALRSPMRPAAVQSRIDRKTVMRFTTGLAVAALLVAVGANYYLAPNRGRMFSTGVGEHQRVTLGDGSLVELNTSTTLRLAADGSTRTAYLEKGEAYFRITHDAAHPFVVIAGNRRIIDVGTTFVVRREPKKLSVALVEGRARFDTPSDQASQAIELKPGDEVVATAHGVERRTKTVGELNTELGWRHGNLVFYGTTLAAAAEEFNRYNKVKLVVADPKAGQLKINGTFAANNARAFVDATQIVLGLKLEDRNGEIVISK